ncbi:Ig-like domain-containing protein [Candidatus Parcubacteria bacterium]|nr:hypothetical protein [Patescibacteria group bacterium]MBU4309909.1 hypothetical protein [Patescibacteria group bacterium]MBU4432539.1 hypothetical protein [Patescibacteria group bacterium]MBU4577834.1 hypothetical protein [Patescibacteria group bacterium]MCG2696895.1 Ig-like domain-containing protein [Candidatus Parcubacteria bacterium]
MLNFNKFKLKTSIKIVAAFLVILQAVFLLQKVFAGSPSTLVVKPLTSTMGFNLTWSFNDSDPDATYFLLKSSSVTSLSCPLVPVSTMFNKLYSGKNTTIYNMNVGDIVPGIKYSFKACLYGSNNFISGIINTPNLLEETNTASAIFTTIIASPTNETVATTSLVDPIDLNTVPVTADDTVATTTVIADNPVLSTDPILNADIKKINLSSVGKDLYWQTSSYFASGFYVLWSKTESPVYHSGAVGMTYFMDPLAKFYTINSYDGAGVYYVRVCEALPAGDCGLYSNELTLNLLADVVVLEKTVASTTTATTSIIIKEPVNEPLIGNTATNTFETVEPIVTDKKIMSEPIKTTVDLSKQITPIITETKAALRVKTTLPVKKLNKISEKTTTALEKKAAEKGIPVIKINSPETMAGVLKEEATSSQLIPSNIGANLNNLPKICVANNILNENGCNHYFFSEATREVKCPDGGDSCLIEAREKYLNGITNTQLKLEAVDKVAAENTSGVMSVGFLKEALTTFSDVVSLLDNATGVKILKSEGGVSYQDDKIIQTGSSILVIDSDNDGLPDDIEKKIGTDPNNKDTDIDGYGDYEEYTNGYNPLGSGKLTAGNELAPVEMAIVNNEIFEQPKNNGVLHEDFLTESITNLGTATSSEAVGYLLQGKATPNTVIALYIYSDLPLMITVKTDDYGNWRYELKQSLSDGNHEVYVALNDATGRVVAKSSPLSFLVKEAQAASLADVVLDNTAPTIESENNNIFVYYLLIFGVSVLAGVIIFINLVKRRRNSDV